jgi:hypothetical protein
VSLECIVEFYFYFYFQEIRFGQNIAFLYIVQELIQNDTLTPKIPSIYLTKLCSF